MAWTLERESEHTGQIVSTLGAIGCHGRPLGLRPGVNVYAAL